MGVATRAGAIALATCLTCQIVSAQAASPDPQTIPVKGIVQVSKVSIDTDTLTVGGSGRCAIATVQVAVVGLGVKAVANPTVTVGLAGLRSKPPGLKVDVSGLTDSQQITNSPGIFAFRVCATALPPEVAIGAMTVQAAVLKVSPESVWRIENPQPSAGMTTFSVNAGPEGPSSKPELRLIVTPVDLQIAKQNGEAVFEFDVAASKGFTGVVMGIVSISEPQNPDGVELLEGTNSGNLGFTLGPGQKLSDAHHLRYRIRTSATNSREGVLTYGLTLNAKEDQFTPQGAAQQVTVKVGAGQ